jgi:hypothetical protein
MNKKLLEKKIDITMYMKKTIVSHYMCQSQNRPWDLMLFIILNEYEKEKYLEIGIKALKERIEDMNMNFYDYQMNSWR